VLNITSATASADSTMAGIATAYATAAANTVDAAQAAKRPLAGTGAGAFTSEGTRAGIRTSEAAVLAIPRLRWAAAAGTGCGQVGTGLGHASAGFGGWGTQAAFGVKSAASAKVGHSPVYATTIGNQKPGNKQFGNSEQINLMTRSYPVTPGGVGPHPAREPDPV
jgi:hypothetical protein